MPKNNLKAKDDFTPCFIYISNTIIKIKNK